MMVFKKIRIALKIMYMFPIPYGNRLARWAGKPVIMPVLTRLGKVSASEELVNMALYVAAGIHLNDIHFGTHNKQPP
jgi:hypothetical protein